jgi:uncharacterized protein (DUF488 family)
LGILKAHEIDCLVDVRSFPGSRRFPHFNKPSLQALLQAASVRYVHMPELGGRRQPQPDSHNSALRNASFRGFADYMETESFHEGIDRLLDEAHSRRVAIMCSEAVWWRCHRSLIADYLKAGGVGVVHILSAERTEPHWFTQAARIEDGDLSYRGLT